jgi:hypothetical protein
MRTGNVPADYATFVAEHGPRLARACEEIVGDDRLAQELHDDLLVAVARRWSRWPAGARARSALAWVERQLRLRDKRLRTRASSAALSLTASPALPAIAESPAAALLWHRAARSRRLWWGRVAGVVAALVAVSLLVPRVAPPDKLPTELPAGVTVLPPLYDLLKLPDTLPPLPVFLRLDAESVDALPSLADEPLPRAMLVAAAPEGRLVLVGAERDPEAGGMPIFEPPERRVVANPALAGARLLTTSLSPDGRTIALPRDGDVVIVDVPTGTVRTAAALPSWARGATARPEAVPTDPPWVGARVGPRWASGTLFVHACDPTVLPLPEEVGIATGVVAAVAATGRHAGTLVTTNGARLSVVGFYGPDWALVLVRSAGLSTLLAWDPASGTLNMGTVVTTEATVAVAGLFS